MYRSMHVMIVVAALAFSVVADAELFVPDLEPGTPYHLIFVTDDTLAGIKDDIATYDEFVSTQAASNSDLAGIEFRALVTTVFEDADSHVDIDGPVYRLDGVMIAENGRDLWDGDILAPINLSPGGQTLSERVWTGSGRNGKADRCVISGGSIPCQLGAPDFDGEQFAGMSSATDEAWITGIEERWTARLNFYGVSSGLMVPIVTVPGDFDANEVVDAVDIDMIQLAIRESSTDLLFDLDASGTVNVDDLTVMITQVMNTYYGDANLDGEFNSSDLVATFTVGEYEDALPLNSTWADGDWNGDQEFTTNDLVFAFSDGGFEQGPRPPVAAAVPEPTGMFLIPLAWLISSMRSSWRR